MDVLKLGRRKEFGDLLLRLKSDVFKFITLHFPVPLVLEKKVVSLNGEIV